MCRGYLCVRAFSKNSYIPLLSAEEILVRRTTVPMAQRLHNDFSTLHNHPGSLSRHRRKGGEKRSGM